MHGFDSTRDFVSQGIVAAILVGVFALLAADRIHRVLIPIGAVALVWLISYFSPFKLISFQAAERRRFQRHPAAVPHDGAGRGTKDHQRLPLGGRVDRLLKRSRGNPGRAA